jgi:signal transduction histidine kinase/ActR/RegA family two-component response regulator
MRLEGMPFLRIRNWPLRLKMAALLGLSTFLPLLVVALLDLQETRERLVENTTALLMARGDQMVASLDAVHRDYQRTIARMARTPRAIEYCQSSPQERDALNAVTLAALKVQPASDAYVKFAAILDPLGSVLIASDSRMSGVQLGYRGFVREALAGRSVTSDVHMIEPELDTDPMTAYLVPIVGTDGKPLCVAGLWVKADAVWDVDKRMNGLAGDRSFAVILDREGIRIGHSYNKDSVFHPAGPLDPHLIETMVAERRFGARTRELLNDVRPFPAQFERARAPSPDLKLFYGLAPVNGEWNYGVARRQQTVPRTVFYMTPEKNMVRQINATLARQAGIAGFIILIALAVGMLFAATILRPIRALAGATSALADGDLKARVQPGGNDEFGQLGRSFNTMAARLEAQATALEKSRDELELKVLERTAALEKSAHSLELEIVERKGAQHKLDAQVERLNLLHQITRAIGERQDLRSIFQVAVRSVEELLPTDFACMCLHETDAGLITITCVGAASGELAMQLAMDEGSRVLLDENGLSRCVRGQLIYEPDIADSHFPFPARLYSGGLRSLVLAPLLVESKVFGILICARRAAESFSSGECEFLRQLSEHVALAAHQAQIYLSLQQAYDDLRQTQQTVMRQERLRALGQMASGIAHDINNALSPASLYAEALLEREPQLGERSRVYLETIQRAIEDVGHTVARMREFYRPNEQQDAFTSVNLNRMMEQVAELTRVRWSDMPLQRGTVIELNMQPGDDLPFILGNESEIREALTNLVFNAIDAMPDGGILTLRSFQAEAASTAGGVRHVAVEVGDTGIGMDETTLEHCQEPFFTTKGERGTGLGLAMVYGVAQRHSVEIEIDSAKGIGTTFRLLFPVPAIQGAEAYTGTDHAPLAGLSILVIDDDPLLLKSLKEILENDGHRVHAVDGGRAGIDAFNAALANGIFYAAVITDLGMPNVDGRQVANKIKTASPSTPVIMLTGWGQRLAADGEIPAHVDCMLNKPPKLADLRRALVQCCTPTST